MARESFDKEIQFLRLVALAGGAYNRQQFASRLGISVHTLDKTIRSLKQTLSLTAPHLTAEQTIELTEGLRYNYYESADPLLLFLYRAKSLKESESIRLTMLLASLQDRELTAKELQDICSEQMPADMPAPDEKTIRGDLKYLEEIGVISRLGESRPYRYRAANDLIEQLTDDELLDLFDFVDVTANTQVPSVQGYLLRDTLKKALKRRGIHAHAADTHRYKYHYHSRILDEAHLYTIFSAIRQRRKLHFIYLAPRKGLTYTSQNTNPLYEKETRNGTTVVPLRVIFDHQYGRWYLIGYNDRTGIAKFRMEGLTQLEEGELVPEDVFEDRLSRVLKQLRNSWVTDTLRTVKVVVRFFNPDHRSGANFIRERVLAQGQWGKIKEESDNSFLFEIKVNGTYEIKPWLRSFGSNCEVLEPAWLRKEFIAEWKEIASYYEPVRKNF
ncbi:helix-turn-helix transcriptional regulator [Paenibacillus xylaniclasticus]|uniref:helix-turn-helix transcriptional regulator n=1 Tax=Paenibacillus xylaniclasticus TaxID=588083 RepID=UPI000FD91A40|nr:MULTISPECIES: WYL domain-containing protein [Paenibacillus]GFN31479.1 hypothetical protein PCURB6_17390 [Paenibacillus curdlanolyticus]